MLAQLAAAHPKVEIAGGNILGVAPAARYQAERLMSTSVPFELFLDREGDLRRRIELGTQTLNDFLFNVKGWQRYAKAFAKNRRQGRITGSYSTLPAMLVVDANAAVTYLHQGTSIADYPPLRDVTTALNDAIGTGHEGT
jgi:hypothetical protein